MRFIIRQFRKKNLRLLSRANVKRKLLHSVIGMMLVLTSTSLWAQDEETGFVVDKIIAKVDNYIVLKSELDKAFLEYVSNGGNSSPQVRCQFLALLLRNKLMMAKAEIDSIVVSDSEVDANT